MTRKGPTILQGLLRAFVCFFHIQLLQFTLLDQSFKGTGHDRLPTTSSTWNPNISSIQMARHRRSSLYGQGIVNFADNYSLRSHIPLRSCLVGLRFWSDNVNWNSCIHIWFSIYLIYFPVFHSTSNNSNIIKTHLWILLKSLHCYLCLTFWCTTSLSDIILTLYKFSCVFRVHTQYTSRTFGTRQLCILLRTTHISVFITFVTLNFNNHDDI